VETSTVILVWVNRRSWLQSKARLSSSARSSARRHDAVVFLPLGLLAGVSGSFFRALCLTLGARFFLSLVFAVTLIPLLSERFLSGSAHNPPPTDSSTRSRRYERGVAGRWHIRGGLLLQRLRCRAWCFAVSRLETGFLPEMDEVLRCGLLDPARNITRRNDKIVRGFEEPHQGESPKLLIFASARSRVGLFVTERTAATFW